jgi:antitoxin component YwqK of YwqJK toxin-antitoxin module
MSNHTYWINGVLREIVDGVVRREIPKADGVSRYWHANGVLAKEMSTKNGLAEGVVREWHDNGQLALEYTYLRGEVDGIVRQWNREGRFLGGYEMKMGWGVERRWNEDGTPKNEMEKLSESATRGKIWDDLGKAREVYLWNGKPVSKKKCLEKLDKARSVEQGTI